MISSQSTPPGESYSVKFGFRRPGITTIRTYFCDLSHRIFSRPAAFIQKLAVPQRRPCEQGFSGGGGDDASPLSFEIISLLSTIIVSKKVGVRVFNVESKHDQTRVLCLAIILPATIRSVHFLGTCPPPDRMDGMIAATMAYLPPVVSASFGISSLERQDKVRVNVGLRCRRSVIITAVLIKYHQPSQSQRSRDDR